MKHISELMPQMMAALFRRQALFQKYTDRIENTGERFNALRAIYSAVSPELVEAGREWTDPYSFDFSKMQSPIERLLWNDIRGERLGLYPEYPVARFYVDFYNPAIRVGIEADGKQWHSKERDLARDTEIFDAAEAVLFRVTGAECHRGADTPWHRLHEGQITKQEYPSVLEHWYLTTSSGVVRAMSVVFYGVDVPEYEYRYCVDTLSAHCLVPHALDYALAFRAVPRETFLEAA